MVDRRGGIVREDRHPRGTVEADECMGQNAQARLLCAGQTVAQEDKWQECGARYFSKQVMGCC